MAPKIAIRCKEEVEKRIGYTVETSDAAD